MCLYNASVWSGATVLFLFTVIFFCWNALVIVSDCLPIRLRISELTILNMLLLHGRRFAVILACYSDGSFWLLTI